SDKISYGDPSEMSSLTGGGAEAYEVPGAEHQNIIHEPYVRIWTEYLKMHLKGMQGKRGDKEA
ncbi:MAG: hypothetical protein WA610_06045, partial [Thermodesulfovibrionales bacterium]